MQNEVFLSGCDFLSFCDFFSLKIYIIHKFAKKKYLLLCRCLVLSSDSKNLATEGYLIIWNCLIAKFQIRMKVKVKSLSRARLFATPWTVAYQAPRSMGFSRQEYWSGLPFSWELNSESPVAHHPFGINCPNENLKSRSWVQRRKIQVFSGSSRVTDFFFFTF